MEINIGYNYQKPENTYTIDQFIACQSDTSFCYANTSFVDQIDNIKYCAYNVLSDYISEINKNYCVDVELTDEQYMKYIYRPKLLCYDIYGSQELYFIILLLNDMCSVKEFAIKKLRMPTRVGMNEICKGILNVNRKALQIYNADNVKKSSSL